jgi:hypothetical protein
VWASTVSVSEQSARFGVRNRPVTRRRTVIRALTPGILRPAQDKGFSHDFVTTAPRWY